MWNHKYLDNTGMNILNGSHIKWNVVNEGKLVDNVNCDMWYINYTTSRHHVRWL